MTLEAYEVDLHMFKIWMKDRGYTKDTQQGYLNDIQLLCRSLQGKHLTSIRKIDVMSHLTDARERGAGDGARNRALSAIRLFFKVMIEFERMDNNPAVDISKSKVEKNRLPIYLEESDLGELLRSVEGHFRVRDIAMLALMSYCGLRVSEVSQLDVQDFDSSSGQLSILGKGRKWRYIPLQPSIIALLKQCLQERIPPKRKNDHPFFVSRLGRRISRRTVQFIVERTFEQFKQQHEHIAERKLSAHKLRHSFATNLLSTDKVDLRTLQELLGHADISTTQIYTHITDKKKKQAMAAVQPDLPMFADSM
ncbi:tyrosine-type recombinase/integrase [Paenibacillus sp. MMS18-CY102]|uniref:tyrosine-type recombinase/integrase n=1 Tax=Paenibacillus sp. MMS18-CY102 TaxID=2682849 RepID=UPI0013667842|nr:tyrosine-type recombinase/integrase [Paenibacillus sp. MMS18-CY102]MWC28036.1 tyrosine-type recombinase/integrase [Paenibacillus sp. MMS18-CY102]